MSNAIGQTERITRQSLQAEQAKRELARRHLINFGQYMRPDQQVAAHQKIIAEYLEKVYLFIASKGSEGIGRLMILMPPQHTKTTWASQYFPAWTLGKLPNSHFLLTSYGADLATENSRSVRNMILGDRYVNIFGERSSMEEAVVISSDSRSSTSWKLGDPFYGGVVAAGVGGGLTGRPADCVIIDDPTKNREEADSLDHRKKLMDWYASSVSSRLRKGSAVVIFHTRWHRLDLIGQLLRASVQDPRADQWVVLCLPAMAYDDDQYAKTIEQQRERMLEGLYLPLADPLKRKPGEVLWHAEFPPEMMEKTRINLETQGNAMDWFALYQQQPRPEEGEQFSADDFVVIDRDKLPNNLRWVRYCDPAISKARQADFTCTFAIAVDDKANLYLRDRIREKGWDAARLRIKNSMLSELERGTEWGFENNAFQELALRELSRDPELIGVIMRGIPAKGDKVSRAKPFASRAKAKQVFLVHGPWVESFIAEAIDFPRGAHDDQIDSCSGGMEMLSQPKTIRMHSAVA